MQHTAVDFGLVALAGVGFSASVGLVPDHD